MKRRPEEGGGTGRRAGPLEPAALARIGGLRRDVEAALAALTEALAAGEGADEIAGVLEDLGRRARRWRLTEARLRAAAPALVAALHVGGVPARDPRAWIDADVQQLIVLADWPAVAVTPSDLADMARRVAEVLKVEVAAVQVASAAALPADVLERVWTEGCALSRYT